jgi:pimeloyl-ACP methyl ester carboxylesterase
VPRALNRGWWNPRNFPWQEKPPSREDECDGHAADPWCALFVDVIGHGPPLLLMHGQPGLDHVSLTPFRQLADRHTLIFYDHRCNGRSIGAPVTSMTLENLSADADALREELGFGQWAVLGPHVRWPRRA